MRVDREHAVIYEMNVRQMTAQGTLKAAAGRLDFLSRMGVTVIWLMPVYPIGLEGRKGTLGSYYSIADYTDVNPEFGTMSDLDDFVREAHRLGMAVILDWVANHTARDARWVDSRPADWYERDEAGVPLIPWDWSDTAKLNYSNRDLWTGQADAMAFWLTEHDIDGFRCDMAMLVPTLFWETTRRRLELIRPGVFMLAEAEGEEFLSEAFDACYSWKIHHTLCDIAAGRTRVWSLRPEVEDAVRNMRDGRYLMNFTSNHDENSWSGSEFDRMGDAARTMAALSYLLPHTIPLIYTGQEYGYDHVFAFFDRDPMPEMEENGYTAFYRTLNEARRTVPAMATVRGEAWYEIRTNAPDCLLVFARECQNSHVVGYFNLSPYTIKCDFNTGIYAGRYTDLMSAGERELKTYEDGVMAPWEFHILV